MTTTKERIEKIAERHKAIARVMTSGEFNEGERFVAEAQLFPREMGGFKLKLWEAICNADEVNKAKLALGFPEHVAAVRSWQSGNLAERFRRAGLPV